VVTGDVTIRRIKGKETEAIAKLQGKSEGGLDAPKNEQTKTGATITVVKRAANHWPVTLASRSGSERPKRCIKSSVVHAASLVHNRGADAVCGTGLGGLILMGVKVWYWANRWWWWCACPALTRGSDEIMITMNTTSYAEYHLRPCLDAGLIFRMVEMYAVVKQIQVGNS
jgi:hypothetical protein